MFSTINAALFVALIASSNVVNAGLRLPNTTTSFTMPAAAGPNSVMNPISRETANLPLPANVDEEMGTPILYVKRPSTAGAGSDWNGWAYVLSGHYWSTANNGWVAAKIPVEIIYYYNFDNWGSSGLNGGFVNDFFNKLDGTSWWNVVRKYYNLGYQGRDNVPYVRQYVQGIKFDQEFKVDCKNRNICNTINGLQIQQVIDDVISYRQHNVPTGGYDKAVWFVVLGSTIGETFDSGDNSLGGNYCAYHSVYQSKSTKTNKWIKYGVVRVPDGNKGCLFNVQVAGGNSWGMESNVLYHMAHELVEIVTVPNPAGQDVSSAWADKNGKEAMDKCEKFTPTLTTRNSDVTGGNAGLANVNINGRVMILPAVWDPVLHRCALGDLGGNPWKHIGCFKDSSTRALPSKSVIDYNGGMTNERCQAECGAAGYGYAGTENSGECWCSNSYPNQGTAGNCDLPCNGDPTTNCGGGGALNVWQLGGGDNLIKSHVRDNFCIDVPSTANGALLTMFDCHGRENQRWTYNSHDKTIRVKQTGKCLDVPNNNAKAGQRLQAFDCNNSNAQKWIYNANDRTIRYAADTALCLDVHNANAANGATLQLMGCGSKNTAQAWHIVS